MSSGREFKSLGATAANDRAVCKKDREFLKTFNVVIKTIQRNGFYCVSE